MKSIQRSSGFALLTVMGVMAVMTALAIALIEINLSNTRAAVWDSRSLQAEQLLNSGLRFAAVNIASQRSRVAVDATPVTELNYSTPIADVRVNISNEAGRIDLLSAPQELVVAVMNYAQASQADTDDLLRILASGKVPEWSPGAEIVGQEITRKNNRLRSLRTAIEQYPINRQRFWEVATIANGKATINADFAPAPVLTLIPNLSSAEQTHILNRRDNSLEAFRNENSIQSVISSDFTLVENEHLGGNVSSSYRIIASVDIGGQGYSREWIIKMVNRSNELFEISAVL